MTDNLLNNFNVRVLCEGENCSVRYYLNDNELAMGIIRFSHKKKGGRIPQDIITITSMDLDNMVGYIMGTYDYPTEYGDTLVNTIRTDATEKVHPIITTIVGSL
jgi:hypothetical protein